MMAIAWWLYCMAVALLLGLSAAAADAALRASGRPARGVWAAALAASILLPFVVWLDVAGAFNAITGRVPGLVSVGIVPLAPLVVEAGASGRGVDFGRLLSWSWLFASLFAAGFLLFSYLRLRAHRSGWRPYELEGFRVWLSPVAGPAVVGFYRGSIVVPEWVLSLDRRLLRLMLLHEGEHVRARDPRLVLCGLVALVVAPWNLPLWWQFRRLRLAIEVDCDARVLRKDADPRLYGTLLIEVARRRSAMEQPLAVALLDPTTHLERRIRMITSSVSRRARRAVAFGGLAALLVAVAVCVDSPLGVEGTDLAAEEAQAVVEVDPERAALEQRPIFTPMNVHPQLLNADEVRQALERAYPPLLREAGIGGTVLVWFFIDEDGRVRNALINRSSGHQALDNAALDIAEVYRFSPALNRDQRVPVWVSIPFRFESG